MKDLTIWQTIKIGFWLGIGFIIPLLLINIAGTLIAFLSTPAILERTIETDFANTEVTSQQSETITFEPNKDLSTQIEISDYTEVLSDNKLSIIGYVTNKGQKTINSIQLQAELYNAEGKFVYECDEYMTTKLKQGEKENFQIKCGCGDELFPEFTTVDIRVLRANNY